MKTCPRCGKTYTDPQLNFCLEDGELLMQTAPSQSVVDDSPPTVMLNDPRATNPTDWSHPSSSPPAPYQQPQMYPPVYSAPIQNQTLAIVSLCLGVASVTVGWCCSLGLVLGPAALITGFISLSQIKKDPQQNGGRGMAIGGMVAGGVFLGVYVVIILLYGLAVFGSMLGGIK